MGYWNFTARALFGRFGTGNQVLGPLYRPTVSYKAGGDQIVRQLYSHAPQYVNGPGVTPVSITGNGATLQGQLAFLALLQPPNAQNPAG